MTFEWTFVTLAAVSTEDQATDDKDSLDYQYRTAREFGERWGGTWLGNYPAEGFSRSGWYDFSEVLELNEAFYNLARDARAHKFHVIMMENYNRLGDIGLMMFNYLHKKVGQPFIQMRSVVQPLMIEDPKIYHPRRDESTTNALAEAQKANKHRTNQSFRAFELGNTARAREGKYANTFPYAYLKKETGKYNKNGKPIYDLILDETVADLMRKFPSWFLAGASYTDIARRADESGVPPPEADVWDPQYIKYVLRNPFYCAKTFYRRDERIAKGVYRERENVELYDGNHPALWSYDTYLQVRAEMKRREKNRIKPKKTDYNFTKLLHCSECGSHLSLVYSGEHKQNKYWRCLTCGKINISTKLTNQKVADELTRLFADYQYTPTPEEQVRDSSRREITKLEAQLRRDKDAYDAGAYSPQEYAEIRKAKLARLEELKNEQLQMQIKQHDAAKREAAFTEMRQIAPYFHEWISERNPRLVNFQLSITCILTVYPDKTIKAEFA